MPPVALILAPLSVNFELFDRSHFLQKICGEIRRAERAADSRHRRHLSHANLPHPAAILGPRRRETNPGLRYGHIQRHHPRLQYIDRPANNDRQVGHL